MSCPLLTVKEVSAYLKVHPKTVYKWTKEGLIPSVNINGIQRFRWNDLEKWQRRDERAHLLRKYIKTQPTLILREYDKIFLKGGALSKKGSKRWNYGFGGVYIRQNKSGLDRWYIWFYSKERKRIQKVVPNATSRQDAILALHMEVAREFSQEYQVEKGRKPVRFRDFTGIYLENYAKPKKKSWRTDEKYIKAQLSPFFGDLMLSEITSLDVSKFMVKRQKDGVRNSTINRELTVLKKMLSLAIEWEFDIQINPVKKGNYFPENEFRRERVLNYAEEKRLFHAAAAHLKPILSCALATGMRFSEILGLKWGQVDLLKKEITIKAESSKSGKKRIIPINDTLFILLKDLRSGPQTKSGNVFLYQDPKTGKVRPVTTVRRAFVMACKRAGIADFRFHDLRHTFGSRLIEKGADPISVKEILGHADLKTSEIYLHTNKKRMKQTVDLLDEKPDKNAENLEKLLRICNISGKEKTGKGTSGLFSVN